MLLLARLGPGLEPRYVTDGLDDSALDGVVLPGDLAGGGGIGEVMKSIDVSSAVDRRGQGIELNGHT